MSSSSHVTLPTTVAQRALDALRTKASDYAIRINNHGVFFSSHYEISYNGIITSFCGKGAGLPPTRVTNGFLANNVKDGEIMLPPFIVTDSIDEATELRRLMAHYSETKRLLDLSISSSSSVVSPPSSPSSSSSSVITATTASVVDDDVVVVKSSNKRKAVIESIDDEENVTSSSPYFVRVYAHKARIAKVVLNAVARDVTELKIGESCLRRAKRDYTDALHTLKRARKDAAENPIVSEEADLESQNDDE